MKQISSEDAFLRFDAWSKGSRVGINFGRRAAAVNFYLRDARSLKIQFAP
jgi:hypothetical protein